MKTEIEIELNVAFYGKQGGPPRPYGDAYGHPPGGHQQQQRYPLTSSGPTSTLSAQVWSNTLLL